MKFSAILRASTIHQGTSLEIQRQKIEAWAFVMGHEIVAWHETLESGEGREDLRPSIAASLEAIKSGEANGVVVTKLDRLSRSMPEIVITSEKIQKLKGCLVVTEQSIDTSTAAGRFFFGTMTALAEFEREMINERCSEGLRNRKSKGLAMGARRYGWKREGEGKSKVFVEVPEEQAVIEKIMGLAQLGYSLREIANDLNKQEIPTVKGGKWLFTMVKSVVKSKAWQDAKAIL